MGYSLLNSQKESHIAYPEIILQSICVSCEYNNIQQYIKRYRKRVEFADLYRKTDFVP